MPLNVSNRYLLDDYLKDKKAVVKEDTNITQGNAGISARMLSERMKSAVAGNATSTPTKPVTSTPPESVTSTPTKPVTSTPTGTRTENNTGLTENDVNSILTTDHVQTQMNNVLTELMDFMNRKFQYNAKESPLYTILQQQAAKEARIASGRAYSRAVANAGGFGSSYATLAAEEASRQVMEGLDDQQLALYQAAKDEWDSKWRSKVDEYNFLKSVNDQLEGNASASGDVFANAVSAMRERYGSEYNEAAMRADLQAMGLSEEQITSVLANQKQYSEAMKTPTDSTAPSMGASDAFNYIQSLGEKGWNGSNEEQIRAILNAQATAGGWTSEDVEAAIEMLKDIDMAQEEDSFELFKRNPTLSGAQDIMAKAKANGTWDSIKSQVGTEVAQLYVDAINNLDSAYEMLGVDQAAWASLSPEQQKAQIIENSAQRKKDGLIGSEEFIKILLDDVDEMVAAIDAEEITKPATEISNMVITWKNYKDRGYISEKEYNELLNGVTKKIDVEATVKKQAATLGQHASNLAGNVADDLNMSDWWKNFIKGAAKIHVGIVADYNPLSPTFIPSLLSNWKWVRKQLLLNNDQEDAMEELLKAQGKHRGGR